MARDFYEVLGVGKNADQPEIQRVPRQVVHLPAHRHRLHLQGDGAGHPGDPIEGKWPVLA